MNEHNSSRKPFNLFHSSQNIGHQVDIIKAAMPYIPGNRQHPFNMIIKVSELMQTVQSPEPELSACSTSGNAAIDMEGLLTSIQPLCYSREVELINMLLNTFRARRFYQTYQTIASTMEQTNMDQQAPTNSSYHTSLEEFESNDALDTLNAASLGNNQRNRGWQQRNMNNRNSLNSGNSNTNPGSSSSNTTNTSTMNNNRMNSILSNPAMKEMLDSFMTPEQRSTFENISNMISAMNIMNSTNMTQNTTQSNTTQQTNYSTNQSDSQNKVTDFADYSTYPRYDQSNS